MEERNKLLNAMNMKRKEVLAFLWLPYLLCWTTPHCPLDPGNAPFEYNGMRWKLMGQGSSGPTCCWAQAGLGFCCALTAVWNTLKPDIWRHCSPNTSACKSRASRASRVPKWCQMTHNSNYVNRAQPCSGAWLSVARICPGMAWHEGSIPCPARAELSWNSHLVADLRMLPLREHLHLILCEKTVRLLARFFCLFSTCIIILAVLRFGL